MVCLKVVYYFKYMKKYLYAFLYLLFCQGCVAQSSHLIDDKLETVTTELLNYYLYYPKDYEHKVDEKFPILLFLHGGGDTGDSLGLVKRSGPPKLLTKGKEFPFLILIPQNPYKKKWWNTRAVNQLLDTVVNNNRVDKNRIYLTGLSRGGGAAWEMAVQYPNKFAALAVVCGMTPLPYASWINRDMPIWVFHGEDDQSIPISESETMVAKLKEMGYDVQFTKYPKVGHNSWDKAYNTEELYEWFVKQKLKKK